MFHFRGFFLDLVVHVVHTLLTGFVDNELLQFVDVLLVKLHFAPHVLQVRSHACLLTSSSAHQTARLRFFSCYLVFHFGHLALVHFAYFLVLVFNHTYRLVLHSVLVRELLLDLLRVLNVVVASFVLNLLLFLLGEQDLLAH